MSTVNMTEIVWALLAAALAAVAVVFLWELTALAPPPWGIPLPDWRVGLIVWSLAVLLFGLFGAVGYLGWRRQTREEAALVLQDTLWAETRREQRRIARWTAWARRKLHS